MEVKLFAQNFNPFGFLPAKIRFFSQTAYGLPSFLHFYLRQDRKNATNQASVWYSQDTDTLDIKKIKTIKT